tara:strand:+ start:341 stop:601 length:261 start_codon:yes stop_codon:yes gene_type:complete
MDWRDNKKLHKIRLSSLRKALKLDNGGVILSDKKIMSLIYRGFSNDAIYDLAEELFYHWDNPKYWKAKKSLGLSSLNFNVPWREYQ